MRVCVCVYVSSDKVGMCMCVYVSKRQSGYVYVFFVRIEFRHPGGPKWPSGGLLAPLGRQVGHRRALWAEKGESEIVKKFTCRARGASRKVLGTFFSVLSRPRGDFGPHFGRPWVFQGGHFGGSLLKAPKPWILNTFHVKTMILRVPGNHFGSFFSTK